MGQTYLLTWFAVGAIVGSFVNVVIYRLPRGESIVRSGSHCPRCGVAIYRYHNLPLVGWLVVRGRCACCGVGISLRYPLIEGICGVVFALAYLRMGPSWRLMVVSAFAAAVICVAVIDFDTMIIPDAIVIPGALIGLLASVGLDPHGWWRFVVGSLAAAAFMLLLAKVWPGSMGLGDVKMALFMGAVLGQAVVLALFVAFFSGAFLGLVLIASGRRGRRDAIPFGPHLAFGGIVAALAGESIMQVYMNLLV